MTAPKINGMTPGRYHHQRRKDHDAKLTRNYWREAEWMRLVSRHVPVDTEFREWRR